MSAEHGPSPIEMGLSDRDEAMANQFEQNKTPEKPKPKAYLRDDDLVVQDIREDLDVATKTLAELKLPFEEIRYLDPIASGKIPGEMILRTEGKKDSEPPEPPIHSEEMDRQRDLMNHLRNKGVVGANLGYMLKINSSS